METKSKVLLGSCVIGGLILITLFLIVPTSNVLAKLLGPEEVNSTFERVLYEEGDLKAVIKDDKGDILGNITLASHSSIDEVKVVPYGQEEIVMYYDFVGWDLIENGLGKVYFINKTTGEEEIKPYTFVELIPTMEEVNESSSVITGFTTNGTPIRDWKVTGTHFEERWVESELTKADIMSKNTRMGIKTYVGFGDHYDVIWTVAGEKIDRHAEYEAGPSNTRPTTLTPQYTLGGQAANREHGIQITVGYEHIFITKVTVMTGTVADWAYVIASDGEFLSNSSMSQGNASFDYMLTANATYYILVNRQNATWTTTRKDSLSFPIDMTEVSFIKGAQGIAFPYSIDSNRAWDIKSLDLAPAVLIPQPILNITGTVSYSNGTWVSGASVTAVFHDNNSNAKNTTTNATGYYNIAQLPNSTYSVFAYTTNASLNGTIASHVVVGT